MSDIVFILRAEVDGQTVYLETFSDTARLEEDGLRRAETAVADIVDQDDYLDRYEGLEETV